MPADLSLENDTQRIVDETLRRFGPIDILVNNAAIIHQRVNLLGFNVNLLRHVLDVNLIAPALLTKAMLPSMMANE